MKKSLLITLGVCLGWLVGISSANAQPRNTITLTLPYAVTVGTVGLPAGECTITNVSSNGREASFMVQSGAGPSFFIRMDRAEKFDNSDVAGAEVRLRPVGSGYQIQGIRVDGKGYLINQF